MSPRVDGLYVLLSRGKPNWQATLKMRVEFSVGHSPALDAYVKMLSDGQCVALICYLESPISGTSWLARKARELGLDVTRRCAPTLRTLPESGDRWLDAWLSGVRAVSTSAVVGDAVRRVDVTPKSDSHGRAPWER